MFFFWLIVGIVGVAMAWPFYKKIFEMSEKITAMDKKLNKDEKQEKPEVQHLDPGFLLDKKR